MAPSSEQETDKFLGKLLMEVERHGVITPETWGELRTRLKGVKQADREWREELARRQELMNDEWVKMLCWQHDNFSVSKHLVDTHK